MISNHSKLLQTIKNYDSENFKASQAFEVERTEYFFSNSEADPTICERAGLQAKGEKSTDVSALKELVEAAKGLGNKKDSKYILKAIKGCIPRVKVAASEKYEFTKGAQDIFDRIAEKGKINQKRPTLNPTAVIPTIPATIVPKQNRPIPEKAKNLVNLIEVFVAEGKKGDGTAVSIEQVKKAADLYFECPNNSRGGDDAWRMAGLVGLSFTIPTYRIPERFCPGKTGPQGESEANKARAVFKNILEIIGDEEQGIQGKVAQAIADSIVRNFETMKTRTVEWKVPFGDPIIWSETQEFFQKANDFNADEKYKVYLEAKSLVDTPEIKIKEADDIWTKGVPLSTVIKWVLILLIIMIIVDYSIQNLDII